MAVLWREYNRNMEYGICLPIFANPGKIQFRTPGLLSISWETITNYSLFADENNFSSVYIADHLMLGKHNEIYDCLTTMAAIAQATKTIKIYPIHLCTGFGNKLHLVKKLLTIDAISNGRLGLFFDYGWRELEFNQFGYEFNSIDKRIEQMVRVLECVGTYFNNPRITKITTNQKQRFPDLGFHSPRSSSDIWLGEADEPKMLEAIATYGNGFNSMPCSVSTLKQKVTSIARYAEKKNNSKLLHNISLETQLLIRETDEECKVEIDRLISLEKYNKANDKDIIKQLKKVDKSYKDLPTYEELQRNYLIGTPKFVDERIKQFKKIGINHIMLWPLDAPKFNSLELFKSYFLN
ncbi:LLM class flavin-dependent oxidoreductase [Synechococcus sp. MIT S9504]|uniref:LLM class flavin-dependent oxidoreductase n=1 Tax=Synechococcus sp. MIT S9504 TaxID=1801628 RepID=UPI0007BB0C4C|nr:LLM class flavin-dependent oxidoreductase [Synechococcus sp. MIT S9504]KZR82817.1 Pyrimidine monooxygenase RutA [Synechococcus sp. MIT S9504]